MIIRTANPTTARRIVDAPARVAPRVNARVALDSFQPAVAATPAATAVARSPQTAVAPTSGGGLKGILSAMFGTILGRLKAFAATALGAVKSGFDSTVGQLAGLATNVVGQLASKASSWFGGLITGLLGKLGL